MTITRFLTYSALIVTLIVSDAAHAEPRVTACGVSANGFDKPLWTSKRRIRGTVVRQTSLSDIPDVVLKGITSQKGGSVTVRPIILDATINGVGSVRGIIKRERLYDSSLSTRFLTGDLMFRDKRGRAGSRRAPFVTTISNGRAKASLSFGLTRRGGRMMTCDFELPLKLSRLSTQHFNTTGVCTKALRKREPGHEHSIDSRPGSGSKRPTLQISGITYRRVAVRPIADTRFFATFGNQSVDNMLTALAYTSQITENIFASDPQYQNQTGITLYADTAYVNYQRVNGALPGMALTATDMNSLVNWSSSQFRSYLVANVADRRTYPGYHFLFSGAVASGGSIGMSTMGGLCHSVYEQSIAPPNTTYSDIGEYNWGGLLLYSGASSNYNHQLSRVFAHEFGHFLNANHEANSIMSSYNPSYGVGVQDSYGSVARSEIAAFTARMANLALPGGLCLPFVDGSTAPQIPTTTPTATPIPPTPTNTAAPTPTLGANSRFFDFGTSSSPVQPGATRVTESTLYSSSTGFGFLDTNGLTSLDRGIGTDDERDFVYAPRLTFGVNLPNGIYTITIKLGDKGQYAHDNQQVTLEGADVGLVSTTSGQVVQSSYVTSVNDGQLTLNLTDLGGSDPNVVIESLQVVPGGTVQTSSARYFDFGTASSPVAVGAVRVLDSTQFNSSIGYGFLGTSTRTSLDRGLGNDLTRDFVYAPNLSFAVNIPNGTYQVEIGLGDMGSFGHDQQNIYLEGALVANVTTSAGEVKQNTYPISISDGQLNLSLVDGGGSDENVVLVMIKISDSSGAPTATPTTVAGNPTSTPVATATATASPTATATSAGGTSNLLYDFGTSSSPLASGALRVTASSTYSTAIRYGFSGSGTRISLDRGVGSDLERDFVYGQSLTFLADVTNGTYTVRVTLGDKGNYAHDQQRITLEGAVVDVVSTQAGEVVEKTYVVTVSDGQLTLDITDLGGIDPNVVLEALQIVSGSSGPVVGPSLYDFGTATSPLGAGATRVTSANSFSSSQGYGFTSSEARYSLDRGPVGDDFERDFVYSSRLTFAVNIPNGIYSVQLMVGDKGAYAHDLQRISLEGTFVDSVSTVAGQTLQRTYTVTINDGQLNLDVLDGGGVDPNVVIERLEIISLL